MSSRAAWLATLLQMLIIRDTFCAPPGSDPALLRTGPLTSTRTVVIPESCGNFRYPCRLTPGGRQACIPQQWVCDEQNDCPMGDDEEDCASETTCASAEFLCALERRCVSNSLRCDGKADCSEGEDELDCETLTTTTLSTTTTTETTTPATTTPETTTTATTITPTTTTTSPCTIDDFYCRTQAVCMPLTWLCDGNADCMGGQDEDPNDCNFGPTTAAPIRCSWNQYWCTTQTQCQPRAWLCDGNLDCAGGMDERNCEKTTTTTEATTTTTTKTETTTESTATTVAPSSCEVGYYHCRRRQETLVDSCIPENWRCDGEPDCPLGDDEETC